MMLNKAIADPSKRLYIAFVLISALVFIVVLTSVYSFTDPLVNYYGNMLRKSQMTAQANNAIYCQQLSSFSFAANFTCFDSRQELDSFAAQIRK